MANIFKQYFKVFGYALTGLCFGFAFFFLFLNFYHFLEIRREFRFGGEKDSYVLLLNEKLEKIETNINSFNTSGYNGTLNISEATKLKNSFNVCLSQFRNETITELKNKEFINIKDVYNLRESFEDNISSKCLINNFIWLTTAKEDNYSDSFIVKNQGFLSSEISSLIRDTDYIKKELLNNSSYFFNTDISTSAVKNTTKDAFYSVMSSYNKAADFILNMSEWYKSVVMPSNNGEGTE